MTLFGTIKTYDTGTGRGFIAPEAGGAVLGFGKADLQRGAIAPARGQRYGYDMRQVDGGHPQAVNLSSQPSHQQVQREQAERQRG